jgi:hypothetical protein
VALQHHAVFDWEGCMEKEETSWQLLKSEYEQLKQEQRQRIGFRDNLLFVQLAAVGSIGSWVAIQLAQNAPAPEVEALLLIPWVWVVLGWTYIVNDHAISRIGRYVRRIVNNRADAADVFSQLDKLDKDDTDDEDYGMEEKNCEFLDGKFTIG